MLFQYNNSSCALEIFSSPYVLMGAANRHKFPLLFCVVAIEMGSLVLEEYWKVRVDPFKNLKLEPFHLW